MTWTDPRTWVTDELVTAALMNAHVRDNFDSVMHLVVRKASDESLTSTTTVQDDNDLILAVSANGVYQVKYGLLFTAPSGGAIEIDFTFPSGGTIAFGANAHDSSGTFERKNWTGTTSPTTTAADLLNMVSGGINYQEIAGVYVNSSTAGNVTLQWAQAVSSGTPTVMKANSTLWAMQLA